MPEITFDDKNKNKQVDFSKLDYELKFDGVPSKGLPTPRRMSMPTTSQYDPGFIVPESDPFGALADYRASQQDWSAKWANGISKAGVTALTSAAESTVGVVYGLGAVLGNQKLSSFYDNSFTRALDEVNKTVAEAMPNYYSSKAKEYSLLEELGTANFWSDKFMNGVGYMAGSLAAGYGLGKLASISKLTGTEAALLNSYDKAGDVADGVKKLARNYRITSAADFAKNAVFMSVGESGVEARQTKDEVREKLIGDYRRSRGISDDTPLPEDVIRGIEDRAEAAGNTSFGANLAITSVENALMFPKIIGPGFASNSLKVNSIASGLDYGALRAEANLAKSEAMKAAQVSGKTLQEAEQIGQKAYNDIVKTKVLGGTAELDKATLSGAVGKNALYESTQEGLQFVTEKASLDYYGRKYDPAAKGRTDDVLNSIVEGFKQTLGTKEGLESILLGALIGAPSALLTEGSEVRSQNQRSKEVVDALNSEKIFKLQNQIDNFVRQDSFSKQKEDALVAGDMFEYQNAKYGESKATIKNIIDRGGAEALLDKLEAMKGLNEDEYKALTGYAPDFKLDKPVGEIIEEQKKVVTQLKEASDQVNIAFRNPYNFKTEEQDFKNFESLKLKVWDTMTNLTNLDEREKAINAKISKKSTKVIDIVQTRENAINFDQGDFDIYFQALQDVDTSLKLDIEEVKKEYKEKYLKEYKAKVENLKKNDPVLYDSIKKDLADLGRIVQKREALIDNYNKLTNPEKLKKNLNDIAAQDNNQTPEGAADSIVDSEKLKQEFTRQVEEAGYKLDGSEAITIEINGKRLTLYYGIDKDTKQKGWLLFGKKADLSKVKYTVISKTKLAAEKAEKVASAKDTVRKKQINSQIDIAKQKRDNLLAKIFEANEKKISKEKEADKLIEDYKAGKLKISQDKLFKLLDNLQKDIFLMQDWLDVNEPLLTGYDQEITRLEDRLNSDPSIESVIIELETKKKEAEWLSKEIKTVKDKISLLDKFVRKLKNIFKQLFPNAREIMKTWTQDYPGATKRMVYENTAQYQEIQQAEIEIQTKQDALRELRNTLAELELEQQNTEFEISRLTNEIAQYKKEVEGILSREAQRLDGSQLTSLGAIEANAESSDLVAKDFRQSNAAKSTFLATSGRHFIDDTETTDPSQRRWFRTIDKLPNPENGKNLFFLQFFTADDPNLGQYFTDREKQEYPNAIKSILLDASGKPVLADENGDISPTGQPVYTPIHEPSFIFDEAKYKAEGKDSIKLSHNHLVGHYLERVLGAKPGEPISIRYPYIKVINGVKYSFDSVDQLLEEAARFYAKELEDFRNHILSNLKAGKPVYSTVTGKSNGIPNMVTDSDNQPIRNPIVSTFVNAVKEIARIAIPISKRDTKISSTATVVPGTVYVVRKDGKFVNVDNRNLNENEVNFLVDILDFALNTTGDINKQVKAKDSDNYYDIFLTKGAKDEPIVNKLIFYGKPKDANKTTGREIYFTGYGQDRILHFGDKSIPVKDIKSSEELKTFLADKRLNVNRNLLGKNNKFFQPKKFTVNDKGVAEVEFSTWEAKDGLGGYENYLLQKKIISTSISNIGDKTKPQFKGTYLTFSKTLLNSITAPAPGAKTAPKAAKTTPTTTTIKSKTLTVSDLKNLNVGDEITMLRDAAGIKVRIVLQNTATGLVAVNQFNDGNPVAVSEATQKIVGYINTGIQTNSVQFGDSLLTLEGLFNLLKENQNMSMSIEVADTAPATPGATPFGSYTAEDESEGGTTQPSTPTDKKVETEKTKSENAELGQSILQKAGYKNENRLPNGNVKGGQAGWKIRFNIKNPKTGDSYYDDGKATLVDAEYNKRAETLINFLLNYFGSNQKADPKNLEQHYILEDADGFKREPFKHLQGGEVGESDFTIYIGSADDVLKFVSDIRTKHPEILELLHTGNKSEDVIIDDIFKGRIEGRKIGFSGYHVPTNLNKVTGSDDFVFTHNNNRVQISYQGPNLSDILVISEETGKGYRGVFDENMKKDLPELYKNIRNIIGFQLYGKYLTGSNNEFIKLTGVTDAELAALEAPTTFVSNGKAEAENKALAILNRYAEPSSKEIEYQGDEFEGPVEKDFQIEDTSTLGKIIAAFKSLPPVPYNFTSNSIDEFKQKVRDELLEFGLENMINDIISNIDKLVSEQLTALEAAPAKVNLTENTNTIFHKLGLRQLKISDSIFSAPIKSISKEAAFRNLILKILEYPHALKDVNFNKFLSKEDLVKIEKLKPIAKEFNDLNTTINQKDVNDLKRYVELLQKLQNGIIDILTPYLKQFGEDVKFEYTTLNDVNLITTTTSADPLAGLRGVFSAALPTLSDPIEVVTDHYNTYLDEYQAAGMSLESLLESWRNNKGDFNDSPEEFITSEITRLGCKPR